MSHCIKCGTVLPEGSAFCPSCGSPVIQMSQNQARSLADSKEKITLAAFAISLAVFSPPIGLILGIIGTLKYKNPSYKRICQIAIPASFFWGFFMLYSAVNSFFYAFGLR